MPLPRRLRELESAILTEPEYASDTPIPSFPRRRDCVATHGKCGCHPETNVRDLRFLPAVEMAERLTRRCFRYCDTVWTGEGVKASLGNINCYAAALV